MKQRFKQAGSSLIEMVVAIVVISIALTGILGLINNISRNSVDPVIQVQASSFARGMLEQIVEQDFNSVQTLTWDGIQAAYPDSPVIAYAQEAKYHIEISVTPEEFLSLAANLVKRVDVRVKHLLIPQGLTVTYYKTRAQVVTQTPVTPPAAPAPITPAPIVPPVVVPPEPIIPAPVVPEVVVPPRVIPILNIADPEAETTPAPAPEPPPQRRYVFDEEEVFILPLPAPDPTDDGIPSVTIRSLKDE